MMEAIAVFDPNISDRLIYLNVSQICVFYLCRKDYKDILHIEMSNGAVYNLDTSMYPMNNKTSLRLERLFNDDRDTNYNY